MDGRKVKSGKEKKWKQQTGREQKDWMDLLLVGYILKKTKENESPGNVLLLLWNGWNGTGSSFVLMG